MRNNLENENKCLLTSNLAGLIVRAKLLTGNLWTSSESILLRRTPTQTSWRRKMFETWASSRGISRRAPPREAKRASSAIINKLAKWVKDRNHFSLVYHSLHVTVMEAQSKNIWKITFWWRIWDCGVNTWKPNQVKYFQDSNLLINKPKTLNFFQICD